jgi:hypothetical protein
MCPLNHTKRHYQQWGAEDMARASIPPSVIPGMPRTPVTLDPGTSPSDPTYSPLPEAQDVEMTDVHGTLGSDSSSDNESPVYSAGDDEETGMEEGDHGEQFWKP